VLAVLGAFTLLTQMHERYAFAVLAFLALLLPDPRVRWLSLAFGVVFTLNLIAAVPPTPAIASWLPVGGAIGVIGSAAMLAISGVAALFLGRDEGDGIDPAF
jgi:hypothetical protein